jgi:MinD-like ATPase involved in chromosome partitioning or flagellar assembly
MATICFNSYKGGTGKTMTSVNFSALLAQQGKKVALIDFDFMGPAFFSIFNNPNGRFINEVIYGDSDIQDVIIPYNHYGFQNGGELVIGIADPRPQTIQAINRMTSDDFKVALDQTLEMQVNLEDSLGYDYIVIDTGPGLQRDVANAIFISDVVVLVMKPTLSDLEGTKLVVDAMIKGYATDKAIGMIFNRSLHQNWQSHEPLPFSDTDYNNLVKNASEFSANEQIPIFSWVPCMCDVARSQTDRIFVLNYPEHPYTLTLEKCCSNILEALNNLQ